MEYQKHKTIQVSTEKLEDISLDKTSELPKMNVCDCTTLLWVRGNFQTKTGL